MNVQKIMQIINTINEARKNFREALAEAWPIGTEIKTIHGGMGRCIGHSNDGYVLVFRKGSAGTGSRYPIRWTDIETPMKGE